MLKLINRYFIVIILIHYEYYHYIFADYFAFITPDRYAIFRHITFFIATISDIFYFHCFDIVLDDINIAGH